MDAKQSETVITAARIVISKELLSLIQRFRQAAPGDQFELNKEWWHPRAFLERRGTWLFEGPSGSWASDRDWYLDSGTMTPKVYSAHVGDLCAQMVPQVELAEREQLQSASAWAVEAGITVEAAEGVIESVRPSHETQDAA